MSSSLDVKGLEQAASQYDKLLDVLVQRHDPEIDDVIRELREALKTLQTSTNQIAHDALIRLEAIKNGNAVRILNIVLGATYDSYEPLESIKGKLITTPNSVALSPEEESLYESLIVNGKKPVRFSDATKIALRLFVKSFIQGKEVLRSTFKDALGEKFNNSLLTIKRTILNNTNYVIERIRSEDGKSNDAYQMVSKNK